MMPFSRLEKVETGYIIRRLRNLLALTDQLLEEIGFYFYKVRSNVPSSISDAGNFESSPFFFPSSV